MFEIFQMSSETILGFDLHLRLLKLVWRIILKNEKSDTTTTNIVGSHE